MKLAEQIRAHLIEHHFSPARARGAAQIELRAGDIHDEMKLTGRMPAVCSAMGGSRLIDVAGVQLWTRRGPKQGANVWFTYLLESLANSASHSSSRAKQRPNSSAGRERAGTYGLTLASYPAFSGSLILVSCAKSKRATPAKARDLYASTSFRLARQLAERNGSEWRILSAKHGLLHPDEYVEPYDLTLNAMPIGSRRAWADRVLEVLLPLARKHGRVILLAGQQYRKMLMPALTLAGIQCEAPMAHLRQGEQLAWLSGH